MTRWNVVELRSQLSDVLNRAEYRGERTVIHRRSRDAAAIVPIEDLRLLERLIRAEEERIDIAAAEAEPGEPIPLEDLCRELGVPYGRGAEPSPPRRRPAARRASPGRNSKNES